MGLRYAIALLGAMIMASATAFLSVTLKPEMVGAATISVKTCSGGGIHLGVKEERTLVLHNEARADYGLEPLCIDPVLTRAARSHSKEMVEKDYFSHYSYNGEGVDARLKRFGYDWSVCGENIAGGNGEPGEPNSIFELWISSTYHRANILDEGFRQVGVGTYTGSYKGMEGYTMYTVDFGSRSQTPENAHVTLRSRALCLQTQ
jgi:uncharacterized protein YkwD